MAYKKLQVNKGASDWADYKSKRNSESYSRRKSLYYQKNTDRCKGTIKKLWTTLKELYGSKKRGKEKLQTVLGKPVENSNHFYTSSVRDIVREIALVDEEFGNNVNRKSSELLSYYFWTTSLNQLKTIITKLKNR